MKKLFYLTALMGFLISCSSTPKEEIKQPQKTNSKTATVKVSGLNLPITTNWRDWHCQNNYSFSAKFSDNSKNLLEIKRVGAVEKLNKQSLNYPAIYENANLAFFSNGKSAVLGVPKTDEVIASGCLPR